MDKIEFYCLLAITDVPMLTGNKVRCRSIRATKSILTKLGICTQIETYAISRSAQTEFFQLCSETWLD